MCHSLIGHIDDTPTFSYNSTVKEIKMEYTSFVKTCIAIYSEIIQQTALCTSQLSQQSTPFTFYFIHILVRKNYNKEKKPKECTYTNLSLNSLHLNTVCV